MIKESQFMKAELKRLKKSINEKTALETEYEVYEKDLNRAKKLRKELSEALQQWLFSKFQMLNAEGETKDLLEIFKDEAVKIPPAGSGECCEPKTPAIRLPAWLQASADGDVLVGRESERRNQTSSTVLSCLQRKMQTDTTLDAASNSL